MTKAIDMIAAERERQISAEGYAPEYDHGHALQLVDAARAYTSAAWYAEADGSRMNQPPYWPWADRFWKPTGDPVRDLTKAGALIAAAIDSLGLDSRG